MEILETFYRRILPNLNIVAAVAALYLVLELGRGRARAIGASSGALAGLDVWLVVGALVGSRAVSALPEAALYLDNPLDLVRVNTGLSLYGAIGGGALALVAYCRVRAAPVLELADAFALYLPLGIALFHLGCLVYGFCGGRPADLPLGMPLPGHVGLRYPSELYEGVLAMALFVGLLRVSRRHPFPGLVTGLFLAAYPVARAAVDLTRLPSGPWPWADPVVSICVAAVGLVVLLLARRARER